MTGAALYIHIPFCISKCAYCDFFSRPGSHISSDNSYISQSYIDALCREITYRINQFKIDCISTVYMGGGTPSLLSGPQLKEIFCLINNSGRLARDAEITVEVNPDDVTSELLKNLSACGVNRLSCGIQSMNDAALKKACRRADLAANRRALELFNKEWKGQLSLDLISGLPGDNEKTLLASLQEVCAQRPAHISLYSLTIEDNTPFGRQLNSGSLVYDFDEADRLWLLGRNFLEKHGYQWYEVSNFCLTGQECRHNLCYWTHKNYLGAGSGATGTIYEAGGEGIRWTNSTNIEEYTEFWNKTLDVDETLIPQMSEKIDSETSEFEYFMMGLRKLSGVSQGEFEKVFGRRLPDYFIKAFSKYEEKGWCERREGGVWAMSREGMLFLNRFLEEL